MQPAPDHPAAASRDERILALYASGHSLRAVARALDLPLTTVWRIVRRLSSVPLASDPAPQPQALARAIAAQHAITGAAWQIYHAEAQLEAAALAGHLTYTRRRVLHQPTVSEATPVAPDATVPASPPTALVVEETRRPAFRSRSAQLLRIILNAEREIARLEDLYHVAQRQPAPPHAPRDFCPDGETQEARPCR